MPTFTEVVALLRDHPEKNLLVNVKDRYARTQELLLKEMAEFVYKDCDFFAIGRNRTQKRLLNIQQPNSLLFNRMPLGAGSWARLLRRVFSVDVSTCPRCGADLEIVSAVTDAGQICR